MTDVEDTILIKKFNHIYLMIIEGENQKIISEDKRRGKDKALYTRQHIDIYTKPNYNGPALYDLSAHSTVSLLVVYS